MHKIFKKCTAVLLTIAIAACSAVIPVSAAPFETAADMVSKISVGWNLGNSLDPVGSWINSGNITNFETAWGNPKTTEAMIKKVKEAGFNAVRIPVSYDGRMDGKGNIKKEWLDRVEEIVNYALNQELYCIINVHHDTGAGNDRWLKASKTNYETKTAVFKNIWEQVSDRFKDYGDRLLFEGFNEIIDDEGSWETPKSTEGYEVVNNLNQIFVDTVRASGGNNSQRNLVVNTYAASANEKTLINFKLPADTVKSHLIIEIHSYAPFGFTYSGEASWTIMRSEWGSAADKKEIDNIMTLLKKYSDSFKAPIIIGEFGSQHKDNLESRILHADYFVKTAKNNGIKIFWWDNGDFSSENGERFALLDRKNLTWVFPEVVDALINASGGKSNDSESADKTDIAASGSNGSPNSNKAAEKTGGSNLLSAPKITGSKSGKNLVLSWDKIEGAYGYRVYLYNAETEKYVKIKSVKEAKAVIMNIEKGDYKFKVTAVEKTSYGLKNGKASKVYTVKTN